MKSFFEDLVILNTFHNWNILLKSIFTRQEIDKLFDDVIKKFINFLTSKWRWLFHQPVVAGKKWFFRPPEANIGRMIKPFEVRRLQMIPSKPPMSDFSGIKNRDHTRYPKFWLWGKCVKIAHFLKKHEDLIEKNMCFSFKNFIFSTCEWAIANRSREWNKLGNVIHS